MMVKMEFLLVGLGNPDDYVGTPHNIGKDFVVGLARHGKHAWNPIGKGRVSSLLIGPHIVACAVSDGYMNETGEHLAGILRHIDPLRVLVIHDDADLPLGAARVSFNKRSGGHKGVASVADTLGTNAFFRLRVGIGAHSDLAAYVLRPMSKETVRPVSKALRQAFPDAIMALAGHRRISSSRERSSHHTDPSVPA